MGAVRPDGRRGPVVLAGALAAAVVFSTLLSAYLEDRTAAPAGTPEPATRTESTGAEASPERSATEATSERAAPATGGPSASAGASPPASASAFCYHYGGMLAPATMATGSHEPVFGSCVECGQKWYRLYTHACPICRGGGWVHLQVPVGYEIEGRIITEARGTGWCDCCASPVVYRWTRNGGDPEIVLVGMNAGGETAKVRAEACKAIHVES